MLLIPLASLHQVCKIYEACKTDSIADSGCITHCLVVSSIKNKI